MKNYNLNQGLSDAIINNDGASPMDKLMHDLMLNVCDRLRAGLKKYDANTKSLGLSQSIQPTKVEHLGDEVVIGIKAEDYWKFINFGVNGTEVNHGAPTWGTQRSSGVSFHKAILDWIPKRGLVKPSQFDTYDQFAWAIQSNIRKYGKAPKPFYSDVVNSKLANFMRPEIENLLGQAITIKIVAKWQ